MQITEHVHALKIPFQVAISSGTKINRFVYIYIILGQAICLIDSGVATSEAIVFDYIRKYGRAPEEISFLVLTHSHPDHIGAARAIKRESGCTVASHMDEISWIQDLNIQVRDRPVPDFHNLVEGSVNVDRILEDGEALNLGNDMDIKVIHTPGHSKGSISIWFPREGALFCGDAIPLANDMPIYEDILESVLSIKRLKVLEGIQVLLSSWDKPQWGKNAYLKMDEGLCYLKKIHEAVLRVSKKQTFNDSLDLARNVLIELGMPGSIANPLVARSIQSSLELSEMKDLNSC